jgi:hypothetical protein
MTVGAPFNPYKIFRGVFAPYWILEHRGIGAGAKLCYIRLLGFAGKDARCYPSVEKLGISLGVCERQAREYVKELERAGLIKVEQRGLRKTNLYVFLWTADLDRLANSVPEGPDDPSDSGPDRKDPAGQDRKWPSDRQLSAVPDRKSSAGQDRNSSAGPIGINSVGISSEESSSSSSVSPVEGMHASNHTGEAVLLWAKERRLQRLRSDRRIGPPERELVLEWDRIFQARAITEPDQIAAVLDRAVDAASRNGEWRRWAFLSVQVQLAAELAGRSGGVGEPAPPQLWAVDEDPDCDWAMAKREIRKKVGNIPFQNWFEPTRQLERSDRGITIAVSNEPGRHYLETEYAGVVTGVLADLGIVEVVWQVAPNCPVDGTFKQD